MKKYIYIYTTLKINQAEHKLSCAECLYFFLQFSVKCTIFYLKIFSKQNSYTSVLWISKFSCKHLYRHDINHKGAHQKK
jgi:hypothetical protein